MNVGVVLYCQAADYLGVVWNLDRARLIALDSQLDLTRMAEALAFVSDVCAGQARGGSAALQPPGQRFGFLKAPRSTVLQPGPVHGGLTADPARQLEHLLECLVG